MRLLNVLQHIISSMKEKKFSIVAQHDSVRSVLHQYGWICFTNKLHFIFITVSRCWCLAHLLHCCIQRLALITLILFFTFDTLHSSSSKHSLAALKHSRW
jgi:hypothetical protein